MTFRMTAQRKQIDKGLFGALVLKAIPHRPTHIARLVCTALAAVSLVACQGFQAVQPDPTKMLWKVNPAPLTTKALVTPPKAVPMPLPKLKAGQSSKIPALSQGLVATAAVPPVNLGTNGVIGQPVGQVNLADLTVPPFPALGKLWVNFAGSWYTCSAEFVGSLNVILTAGHCAFEQGGAGFLTDATFYLGYNNGSYVSASSWQCAAVYSGWAQGIYHYDYAFIKLRGTGTSALGLLSFSGRSPMTSMGYPINYYSANQPVYENGPITINAYPGDARMANTLSHGASGGAWVRDVYAESLNSFEIVGDPNDMYGPEFDGLTNALYQFVNGSCDPGTSLAEQPSHLSKPHTRAEVQQALKSSAFIMSNHNFVSSAPASRIAADSPSECECEGAERLYVSNQTKTPRELTLETEVYDRKTWMLQSTSRSTLRLSVGARQPLACSLGGPGQSCADSTRVRVVADRALHAPLAPPALRTSGAAAGPSDKAAAPLVTTSLQECRQQCEQTGCLELTKKAAPVFASIAGLVAKVPPSSTKGSSTVLTKADVIKSFGGDPDKTKDPCSRSDFIREDATVVNSGSECTAISTDMLDGGAKASLELQMRPVIRGLPADSKISTSAVRSVSFGDVQESTTVQFNGLNSALMNAEFGGTVYEAGAVDDKLILATSNGCIRAPLSSQDHAK